VEGNPAVHRLGVRERAEHLITLADAYAGDISAAQAFNVACISEAPWVARQLLEALNRIDQLEAENEDLKRSGPTFGGDAKISGYHSTSEPLNPKEADE
jgi:hypothetical protein